MILNYNPCFLLAFSYCLENPGKRLDEETASTKLLWRDFIPASSKALLSAIVFLSSFLSSLLANTFINAKLKRSPIKDMFTSFLISREQVHSKGNLQGEHLLPTKEGDLHRIAPQQGSITYLKFFVQKENKLKPRNGA